MAIPISMLWRVQMPLKKKVALTGIFSLAVITAMFAIIRMTVTSASGRLFDVSWLFMWSSIEQCVGKRDRKKRPPVFQPQKKTKKGMVFSSSKNPPANRCTHYSHHRLLSRFIQGPLRTARISFAGNKFSFRLHLRLSQSILPPKPEDAAD